MKTLGQIAYEAGLAELLKHGHFEKEDGEHSTPTWETIGESKWKAWQASAAAVEKIGYSMNWQPIETAPKTGNILLSWSIYNNAFIGSWNNPANSFLERTSMGYEKCDPEHWMPLPVPPLKDKV
jgi:hypothetical protein